MAQPTGVTTAPRTFGTLSIIFASLVLAGSLFGALGLVVPVLVAHAPPSSSRPEDAAALKMLSTMYLGMGAISVMFVVLSAGLLALGIGQLRYRAWAAVWSPRWAIVALGALVVMAIILMSTMSSSFGGMMNAAAATTDAAAGKQVGTAIGAVYAAMMVLFYAPYPVLLIAFFSRERVRAAMTT